MDAAAMDELTRQLNAAHAAKAWERVTDIWRRMAGAGAADPVLAARAAEAYFWQGLDLGRHCNPDAAIRNLRLAVELQPAEIPYRYQLALAHHRSHNWQAAMNGYREILRLDPSHQRAAYHFCLACLQSGEECQQGGAFDRAYRVLRDSQGAGQELPLTLRRLEAWRGFVLSGSTEALELLWGSPPGPDPTVPVTARPALALEAGLVKLVGGKVDAAARWLQSAAQSKVPVIDDCATALRAVLAARAGHHRKADALARSLGAGDEGEGARPLPTHIRRGVEAVQARAFWETGLALWRKGSPEAALAHWQQARALARECTALVHNFALAAEVVGLPVAGDAWREVARAWERRWQKKGQWERPECRAAVGLAYGRAGAATLIRGEFKQARALLKRAADLAPQQPEVLLALAYLAVEERDLAWLKSNLQRLTERLWDDATHLDELGHLCEEAELGDGTESIWRRVLELDPEHECAGDHLANLYADRGDRAWNSGRTEEARTHFEQGLELVPGAGHLQVRLGGIYLLQGDRRRAEAAFQAAVTGDAEPQEISYAQVLVGKHLLAAGLRREAVAAFDRGLKADNSADAYLGIGLAHLASGAVDEAVKHFRTAAQRSGHDPETVGAMADALAGRNQYAPARELVLEALVVHPEEYLLWVNRAAAEFALSGPQMDFSVARRARTLALQAGDREAIRVLNDILSLSKL